MYCGVDAEIHQGVAKIVPLHRTTVGFCGSRKQNGRKDESSLGKARFVHQKAKVLRHESITNQV
jgi:hypothetical protein